MRSIYHHEDLKKELMKNGLKMIQKEGIEKLSLRKLAMMCNVSEAAPYSHFKNKSELLIAMQEYVTEQLQNCFETAYENTPEKDSPYAIFNIGKAYVSFFLECPEYYTFLFSRPGVKIDLSLTSFDDSFAPFKYFKEKSYLVYRKVGLDDERIKYGIISMWAKVHGIASIASMKDVKKDFEWKDVLEKILVE